MIKLSDLRVPLTFKEDNLKSVVAKKLGTLEKNVDRVVILKKSLDARKKDDLAYIYTVGVKVNNLKGLKASNTFEEEECGLEYLNLQPLDKNKVIAVVGTGPAGLFSALTLLERGVKPVIFERGYEVERRNAEIEKLNLTGQLNERCNVQFGEGGAGTYSDGKLNTGTKSPYIKTVLKEFVKFGAPSEILYLNKPHIGTDNLRIIVKNMREYIQSLGGKFYFGTKVDDFSVKDGKVDKLYYSGENKGELQVDGAIFAIGHSARDTFEMLFNKGVIMERKPFSMGVRIEHLQEDINLAQYGKKEGISLPAADYKLATHLKNGRGVYTFCMCPGGEVVCAASEQGQMAVNGMSYFSRSGKNANSALLVSVNPEDFGEGNALAGVELQRKYERLAFQKALGYKGAVQRFEDAKNGAKVNVLGNVLPSIKSGYTLCEIKNCLPNYVFDGVLEGILEFGKKIKGFDHPDGVLTAIESRSSSPVRILRDENFNSSIKGLYPCGEGAGYAGGITSAAVDGIKTALSVK